MDFSELAKLASGHVDARIVQTALELGVFESLSKQQLDARKISTSLGTDLRATEMLLDALTALQLLAKDGDAYSLGPVAEKYLLKDSHSYLGGMILFDASLWHSWEQLGTAVRTGKPVREPDMYQTNPAETARFIGAMDSVVNARGDAEVISNVLDWTSVGELLDVGSGPATYPIYLCRRFSHLRATVFDLPATIKVTRAFVADSGMADRIQLITGNYRTDSIPGRYDAVFMSNVIHGEGFEENQRLVAKLAASLNPGGMMIIKDHILDTMRARPAVGAVFSLLMLLTTEAGRCYSFEEVEAWMNRAGLKSIRQIELPPPLTSSLVIGAR